LQLIAWNPVDLAYEFYQRLGQGWAWAGNSWDALAPDTRGKGPFDSHVNGALVMKELKLPWLNWHSISASITDDALAPDDPLRKEPLHLQRTSADRLQKEVVEPGIWRWNESRFKKLFQNGVLKRADEFLRQILFATTVNLTSAPEERSQVKKGTAIHLPLTFFLNNDAFVERLQFPTLQRPQVDGDIYAQCLTKYNVQLSDGEFTVTGDTHFVFVVPEPAFEDLVVLEKLIFFGLMPAKLAACLLMVDFQNPLFSARRAALIRHMPTEIRINNGQSDLAAQIVKSISSGTVAHDSAEAEFLANWNVPDDQWMAAFSQRLQDYMNRVEQAVKSFDGFDPFFRLAESRRREFRRRPLAEFRLTTPLTNIPESDPLLEMTVAGTVQNKPDSTD